MFKSKKLVICGAVMLSASIAAAVPAMAASWNHTFSIDVANATDETWDKLAMANDDVVFTGVNIRDAVEEGQIVGCLFRGGAVKVIDQGENWVQVSSGGVEGFVDPSYLIIGNDVKGLVDFYGVEGVEANWNDVCVFDRPDKDATIMHHMEVGDTYELVEDNGHWLTVKFDAENLAYVSIEDVTKVILVDRIVPEDEVAERLAAEGYDGEEEDEEEYYDDSNSYSEPTYNYTDTSTQTTTPTTEAAPAPAPTETTTTTTTTNDDSYEEDASGEEYVDGDDEEFYDDSGEVEVVVDAEEYEEEN